MHRARWPCHCMTSLTIHSGLTPSIILWCALEYIITSIQTPFRRHHWIYPSTTISRRIPSPLPSLCLQHNQQFSLRLILLPFDPLPAPSFPLPIHPSIWLSIYLSIHPFISISILEVSVNSPDGVMCRQEMVGSGFPLAVQMSDTLLPSFTVMSEEMSYILGGTREGKWG